MAQHESMGMKFHVNQIRNMEEIVSLYASGQPTHDWPSNQCAESLQYMYTNTFLLFQTFFEKPII